MSTFENIAYDRVLKGVETILETEFKDEAIVYLDTEYQDNPGRQSVRLMNLDTELVGRFAGGVTNIFPVEITCYKPIGQRSKRVVNGEIAKLSARIKRVMDNNCHYAPSGTYQWHDNTGDIEPNPDREEDVDPSEDNVSMARLVFNPTVTELF